YLCLVAAALLASAFTSLRLRRRGAARGWPMLAGWSVILLTLGCAYVAVNDAAAEERDHLRRIVEGFAPTYAAELELIGHSRIAFDTKSDDPTYLALIEAEKRWLAVNPELADIYTLRRRPDGQFAFVVDSETDYNHDGKINEEREKRTP